MTYLLARPVARVLDARAVRRARLAVYVTFASAGVMFASWVPRIPEMKTRLDLSAGSLGVALLAPSIGALLALAMAGSATARFGSARTTLGFAAMFFALGCLPGLAGSLPVLWVMLFCWGVGMSVMDVAMNAQAVSVEKSAGRPLMSGFHAAWSLGSLGGAGVGTLGATLRVPIAAQQSVVAAVLVLALVIVGRYFVADPAVSVAEQSATDGHRGPLSVLDLRLVLLGVAGLTAMLCEGSVGDWSGILLRDSLHAGASQVGLAYGAFMALQTIGRLAGDRVIHRLGRIRAVIVTSSIGSLGLAAGLGTHTVLGTVAGFAALGIGLAIILPIAFSAAADGRASAGPALAAVSSLSYAGLLAGPAAIGFVAQVTSVPAALWLVPVITAGGAALAVVALRRPITGAGMDDPA